MGAAVETFSRLTLRAAEPERGTSMHRRPLDETAPLCWGLVCGSVAAILALLDTWLVGIQNLLEGTSGLDVAGRLILLASLTLPALGGYLANRQTGAMWAGTVSGLMSGVLEGVGVALGILGPFIAAIAASPLPLVYLVILALDALLIFTVAVISFGMVGTGCGLAGSVLSRVCLRK